MLVIDDNMFRLAKMQETLLKMDGLNKDKNLENYINTVTQIDTKAFADILEEIKHIDEHNQSLEDELQFLEKIKKSYDQLMELQLSFTRVCELYGDKGLKLSDLSRLNIEYIENRINVINGYLVNLKNIEENKLRLQKLNEELIDEEKKKDFLSKKLLESEKVLRDNFSNAEGRYIVDGQLQYTSVVSEYERLGLNFKDLLTDVEALDKLLAESDSERTEVGEKLRAAEFCYNNAPSAESKQILDEINKDFMKVKYKLTMLKILKFLSQDFDKYDLFKDKREKLLDLIKYRLTCIDKLGSRISIDPFGRTKVKEQLETILSLPDNSKIINRMRKEISQLNARTEEMLSQNSDYLISLSDTKAILQNNVGMGDIDITSVDYDFIEPIVSTIITDNQVVRVRSVSDKLNMSIVNQKTAGVVKRVNQMINGIPSKIDISEDRNVHTQVDTVVPELVIVPKEEKVPGYNSFLDEIEDSFYDDELEIEESNEEVIEEPLNVENNMFETVVPFYEPAMFMDRTEDSSEKEKNDGNIAFKEIQIIPDKKEEDLELKLSDSEEQMPEAFWVTQEDEEENLNDDNTMSFDDQINVLLSSENNDSKTRKLVA